jgi:D-3-phosphoglycerate dehydrogenase
MEIFISTTTFGEYDRSCIELCRAKGLKIIFNPYGRKVKPSEFLKLARNAIGVIAGTESIAQELLLKLSHLRVISRCGAGLDNIDLAAAERLGIKVFNTADAPTLAVAELTIGLILNLLRRVNQMDSAVRRGKWKKKMGNLLQDKKVGIIGFGRIGKKVAGLLKPFECKIAYCDPFIKKGLAGIKKLTKNNLLRWADIVSVHVSAKNRILDSKEFKLMKKGAWLINVSRGEVINETVLYKYLKRGYLSGAAIDVFEEEPYNGPLKRLDNVILTPHIGSYAKETRVKMEMQAVQNLLKGLKGVNKTK